MSWSGCGLVFTVLRDLSLEVFAYVDVVFVQVAQSFGGVPAARALAARSSVSGGRSGRCANTSTSWVPWLLRAVLLSSSVVVLFGELV